MPRLVTCHICHILQKFPDVPAKTPMIPARLQWESGEEYVYKDDNGHPVMVPAYDPMMEDFVEKHQHGLDDNAFTGGVIQVYTIDQKTWDAVDVVTEIRKELQAVTDQWYEDRDFYRDEATKCYNAHGNPTLDNGCPDYMDRSKMIGTSSYRDDFGKVHDVPMELRQYLCWQCPFQQSYINVEVRRRKGAYKDN